MEPNRTLVLYVDPDALLLGAVWVLLGATFRHLELNDIPFVRVAGRSDGPWVLHTGPLHSATAATAAKIDALYLVHGVGLVGRIVIARSSAGARHAPFDKAALPVGAFFDQAMQQVK